MLCACTRYRLYRPHVRPTWRQLFAAEQASVVLKRIDGHAQMPWERRDDNSSPARVPNMPADQFMTLLPWWTARRIQENRWLRGARNTGPVAGRARRARRCDVAAAPGQELGAGRCGHRRDDDERAVQHHHTYLAQEHGSPDGCCQTLSSMPYQQGLEKRNFFAGSFCIMVNTRRRTIMLHYTSQQQPSRSLHGFCRSNLVFVVDISPCRARRWCRCTPAATRCKKHRLGGGRVPGVTSFGRGRTLQGPISELGRRDGSATPGAWSAAHEERRRMYVNRRQCTLRLAKAKKKTKPLLNRFAFSADEGRCRLRPTTGLAGIASLNRHARVVVDGIRGSGDCSVFRPLRDGVAAAGGVGGRSFSSSHKRYDGVRPAAVGGCLPDRCAIGSVTLAFACRLPGDGVFRNTSRCFVSTSTTRNTTGSRLCRHMGVVSWNHDETDSRRWFSTLV